jgi:hypothetical protein
MTGHGPRPTPYPDVNAALDVLQSGVQTALGERFTGQYLYEKLDEDLHPPLSRLAFHISGSLFDREPDYTAGWRPPG